MDWVAPSAGPVERGLKNSHDMSFRFRNFVFAMNLFRLLKSFSLATEFGQADLLSFLPVPSPGTVRSDSVTFRYGLGRHVGLLAAEIQGSCLRSEDCWLASSFGEVPLAEKRPPRCHPSSPTLVRRT